ncbi:class F sortase [Streptomyces sodiiphilus]|uniref:Class F sortase n=1 Tax=Streptomyces sodiiphilus TaxID=226217 RepID=A0ABN2PY62_9ACTN
MAVQQPPQTNEPSANPKARRLGRALILPVAAMAVGVLLILNSMTPSADPEPQARPAPVEESAAPEPPSAAPDLELPRSAPKRLTIPAIGVDAPFTALAVGESGRLDPPPKEEKNLVGWFEDGASPGERGTSIVVGHLDTTTGPAVFAGLDSLKRGGTVNITREDGTVATFKIDKVKTFDKDDFPDDLVYNDTPSPQLRLITCAGEYDRKTQNYKDNLVLFAHLDSVEPA